MKKLQVWWRDGLKYMDIWPKQQELALHFPEIQVIRLTRLGWRWCPVVAALAVLLPVLYHVDQALPSAVVTALFALGLPLQGVLWLGRRSAQPLPPGLRGWYLDVHHRMVEQGCELKPAKQKPRFKDMGLILKEAYSLLNDQQAQRLS